MSVEGIFNHRLLLVVGKGGVGKTAIAGALALEAASRGKRTLLIEIESETDVAHSITGNAADQTQEAPENLELLNLARQEVLDNFVSKTIRVKSLAHKLTKAPIYQYLTAVTPGLRELMVLNTIYDLERKSSRFHRHRPLYDNIIVDAPATGYGLSFLEVPGAIIRSVKVGPIKARAQRIRDLLRDEQRSGIVLVTLAEELPISEAIEFYHKAEEKLHYPVIAIIVNALYPGITAAHGGSECLQEMLEDKRVSCFLRSNYPEGFISSIIKQLRYSEARFRINQSHLSNIQQSLQRSLIQIPYFPVLEFSRELSERIRAALFTVDNSAKETAPHAPAGNT